MKAGASIVNAASVAGLQGTPRMGAYSASKHGVVALTRTAAKDFGKRGIRVNAIAPGYVKTPMTAKINEMVGDQILQMSAEMSAFGRVADPSEMAGVIAFLLSDDASYVSLVLRILRQMMSWMVHETCINVLLIRRQVTGSIYTIDAGLSA